MTKTKPKCKQQSCGFGCISINVNCLKDSMSAEENAVLNKYVSFLGGLSSTIDTQDNIAIKNAKADAVADLLEKGVKKDDLSSQEQIKALAEKNTTAMTPDEASALLARKITNPETGEEQSIEDYSNWMESQSWYEGAEQGSKAKEEADRVPGDRRLYTLPSMKPNSVTDEEVDAVYQALDTNMRNVLFPRGAGAPKRDEPPNRLLADWGGDSEKLQKAMLKAALEQTGVDPDTGELGIIDSWTGKAIKGPMDLDHIVPLAKGGSHGPKREPDEGHATGPDAYNFDWTSTKLNQNYKGDRDIVQTVARLKQARDGKGKKSGQDLYDKVIKDASKKIVKSGLGDAYRKNMVERFNKASQPDGLQGLPTIEEFNSFASTGPDIVTFMKAMRDGAKSIGLKFPDNIAPFLSTDAIKGINKEFKLDTEGKRAKTIETIEWLNNIETSAWERILNG